MAWNKMANGASDKFYWEVLLIKPVFSDKPAQCPVPTHGPVTNQKNYIFNKIKKNVL